MDIRNDVAKVKTYLDKAQHIFVVTHEHPTADSIGSALAIYLGLTSLGKTVTIACPDDMTVELSSFIGINKIISNIGQKTFIVSLDYIDGSIEKVSYNIENNKFNLVIEQRPGFEPFSKEKVSYQHSGVTADMIICVDTIHLGGLKKLYEENKELYAGKAIVNIDRHVNNSRYGLVNIIGQGATTTAELTAHLLSGLGVKLSVDLANNLLNAVYGGTNNFTLPGVSASAFEVAAVCTKAGAKRFGSELKKSDDIPSVSPPVAQSPSISTDIPNQSVTSGVSVDLPIASKSEPDTIVTDDSTPIEDILSPIPPQENITPGLQPVKPVNPMTASGSQQPDWLKPRIFKGPRTS